MDEEIKQLIDDYVKQIESNETDLVYLRNEIDKIILSAEKEMKGVLSGLDVKFDANEISEEEYLKLLREAKESILQKTKSRLDSLVKDLER